MKNQYRIDDRLEDVISLISVLAINPKYSYRSPENLHSSIGKPKSADNWTKIAECHREFFRVSTSGKIILLARFARDPKNENPTPLEMTEMKQLIDQAIGLQAKQLSMESNELQRKSINRVFIAAIIAAITSLVVSGVSIYKINSSNESVGKKLNELKSKIEMLDSNSEKNKIKELPQIDNEEKVDTSQ